MPVLPGPRAEQVQDVHNQDHDAVDFHLGCHLPFPPPGSALVVALFAGPGRRGPFGRDPISWLFFERPARQRI